MKSIAFLASARPNYMKVFPVWKAAAATRLPVRPVLIHTGQHYDEAMSDVFFRDFEMEKPTHFLGVGSGPHGLQTAKVMMALEELFTKDRPDLLLVVGDVNSTMAGALVAVKMGIPVAHIEAGLRSFDRTMPEEINRIVTDSISDLLLLMSRISLPAELRVFLATGILGGYTTFSAFSLEVWQLAERGEPGAAAAYVAASVVLSVAGLGLGLVVARWMMP